MQLQFGVQGRICEAGSDLQIFFFGDVEISLVVIRLGVTRLKKTGFVYLVYLVVVFFGGKGEKGWFDLECVGVFR